MRIRRSKDEEIGINVTPIIDMVFLLLIFFLVATKFADIERDVRVKPPSSRHARPITEVPQEIVVNVTREGQFLVGGKPRQLDYIDQIIKTAVAENPQQAVVIRGDRSALIEHAVNVLDVCEKNGIKSTFLTTRKIES